MVIGGFFDVYNHLGRGFLESVYEGALALALEKAGLNVHRQYPVPVYYRGTEIGFFRADLLVNDRLIIEIKRARRIHPRHKAQLINVLKATTIELGLLLNFGPKPLFKRVLFTNDRK
jgi:GxxExxY protein